MGSSGSALSCPDGTRWEGIAARGAPVWWHRGGGQKRGGAATGDGAQRRGAGSGAGRRGRCPDPEGIEEWVSEGSGDVKWLRGGVG